MPSGFRNSSASISPGETGLTPALSVVVDDFDFFGISIHPDKANPESIVDAHAPLAGSIPSQGFEPVARRNAHVVDALRQVELYQLAQRRSFNACEPCRAVQSEEGLGIGALERLDGHSNAWRY